MKRLLAAAIIGLMTHGTAAAADGKGKYTVLGAGTTSCATWSRERKADSPQSRSLMSWVHGYISAYNAYVSKKENIFDKLDIAIVVDWVDSHCLYHVNNDLHSTADALIESFK